MSRPVKALMALPFPPKCVFCESLLRDEGGRDDWICPDCRRTLPGCSRVRSFPCVQDCRSAFYHEEHVREAILRYKFADASQYSQTLGRCVGATIRAYQLGRFDILSWVPVSRKRLRERGYDQAELLARGAGAYLDMPVVSTLEKVRHNQPQSGLEDASRRSENVQGVYETVDPAVVRGKTVLLIDDVVTTGSTLSECARVLVAAGAEAVLAATLASVRE